MMIKKKRDIYLKRVLYRVIFRNVFALYTSVNENFCLESPRRKPVWVIRRFMGIGNCRRRVDMKSLLWKEKGKKKREQLRQFFLSVAVCVCVCVFVCGSICI